MRDLENKPDTQPAVEPTKRFEQGLQQDRLGGWPAIPGVVGMLVFLINMLARGWGE